MYIAMDYLIKAHFESDNESLKLSMPISKVDIEKRIVSGFATLDNIDRQGDKLLSEASIKAFEKFKGNVRLMHQPIPAGKLVSFRQNSFFDPETKQTYNGIFVDAYISKGAENIWQMVLDGTLTGFSVGGRIVDAETVMDEGIEKAVRVVKEYDVTELSLVDSPANQLANIFSIQKTDNGFVADGIFNKSNIQNVFWCESDKKAFLSEDDAHECIFCKSSTSQIGWIDETDADSIAKSMSTLIKTNNMKKEVVTAPPATAKNPPQGVKGGIPKKKIKKKKIWKSENTPIVVGDFVAYKKGDSYAKGKIVEIKKSGTFKDKNTQMKIVANENNPVAIINLYKENENGKHSATKTKVAQSVGDVTKLKVKGILELEAPKEVIYKNDTEKTPNKKEGENMLKRFISAFFGKKEQMELSADNTATVKAFDDILKKSFDLEKTLEGGVEMAENTNGHEELDTAQAEETETVVTEEVEFEIEETVEETPETTETEEVPAEQTENAENAPEELEITKALDQIKSFIGESISKSFDSTSESLSKVQTVIEGLSKSFDDKVGTLQNKYEELEKGLAAIINRVESVENDTAIKKSGEFEGALPEAPEKQESIWGGRFLGKENIFN